MPTFSLGSFFVEFPVVFFFFFLCRRAPLSILRFIGLNPENIPAVLRPLKAHCLCSFFSTPPRRQLPRALLIPSLNSALTFLHSGSRGHFYAPLCGWRLVTFFLRSTAPPTSVLSRCSGLKVLWMCTLLEIRSPLLPVYWPLR